jgi:hypothetical protein
MPDNQHDLQRFQWRKKLWLFGSMAIVGLVAIFFFAGC